MSIKTVWSVYKGSSIKDKDMQKAFQRAATPNACIELLEELEVLEQQLATARQERTAYRTSLENLEASLPKIKAEAVLSILDTPCDCDTPTGDIAWCSESIQLIADFKMQVGQ